MIVTEKLVVIDNSLQNDFHREVIMATAVSNNPSFRIEQATVSHVLAAISALVNAAYKKVSYLHAERVSVTELRSIVSNPLQKLYICLSPQEEICGTLLVDYDSQGTKAELGMFSVHLNYQGQNVGVTMMQ